MEKIVHKKMLIPAPQISLNTEKRRHRRRQWTPKLSGMFVSPDGKRTIQHLRGVDISEGGMGIAGQIPHPVGTQLIVNLPERNGRSRYVHAKIVRCWEGAGAGQKESEIRMGLEFNDSPDDGVMPIARQLRIAA